MKNEIKTWICTGVIVGICALFTISCYFKQPQQQIITKIKIVPIKTVEEKIVEKEVEIKIPLVNTQSFQNCLINFEEYSILQNPELPTGCEVTSLCMVLNYLGYNITKTELVDNYLPKGEYGINDPEEYFLGSPYNEHGCGCFITALINTVNNYNKKINTTNLQGVELSDLKPYISSGNPVIIWVTIDMIPSTFAGSYLVGEKQIDWYYNEHCVVLIGYDKENYYIADPLHGITIWESEIIETRYNEMQKRALLVWKENK